MVQAHPDKSGVFALPEGLDAFATRVLLAGAAEHKLDVQYYIWHHAMSGTLLFEALHRAADRGVRVRLLLDDNNTVGLDPTVAALDAHPNIEIWLFNPFKIRRWRVLDCVIDFARLNRPHRPTDHERTELRFSSSSAGLNSPFRRRSRASQCRRQTAWCRSSPC